MPVRRASTVRSRAVILAQVGFWLAACLILAFLLWLFHAILMPFVVALVLGYLLDPLVGRMERLGLGRGGATTIILVGSLLVMIVTLALFSPMLARQVAGFIKALPDLVKRAQDLASAAGEQVTHGRIGELLDRYGLGGSVADIRSGASDYVNKAVAWLAASGNSLLSRTAALLDLLSLIVITPVVAFYILLDWPRMLGALESLIPPHHRETVHAIGHDIDRALAGFLRGQLLVCLFLAAWYGIGLTIVGLNFGLLIGLLGGILSFVPYVGSLIVLVLSLLIAIVQGWPSWHLAAFALGVVLIGQFLGRQRALAQARRRQGRAASGMDHLRFARLRQRIRVHRSARGRTGGLGHRSASALRHTPLSREPNLHWRADERAYLGDRRSTRRGADRLTRTTGAMARQLVFDLARAPCFDRDDFLVSTANEAAVAAVRAWPDWPSRTLLLVGPSGSGKSHLAAIWAEDVGASIVRENARLESSLWNGGRKMCAAGRMRSTSI